MALKISIDHSKLIDSPYSDLGSGIFDYTSSDTDDFVQDIIKGNPTCYLISGYRGSGKSSFIKKLEHDVSAKNENSLFVYLNFAKHEERTILLRKLIRNFYLQFEDNKELYERISANPDLQEQLTNFKELHDRTFYAVSRNTNEKKSDVTTSSVKFSANLKEILMVCVGTMIAITAIGITHWYSWALALLAFFGYEKLITKEEAKTSEISKDMLYDDEIAEYYIIQVINSFKGHINVVFVLDELDKINDDELVESLVNELKPIMLSGLANFVVVAGQYLYYNYYLSQSKDDSSLSSLFSKVHHVSLFSASELRVLFSKIASINVAILSPKEQLLLDCYIDYLIFESKRVPRRFVLLIRQKLSWDGDKAYMEIEKPIDELRLYSKILKNIENIDDKEISNRGYPESIRDYFNMQLFLKAHRILNSQDLSFTHSSILSQDGE